MAEPAVLPNSTYLPWPAARETFHVVVSKELTPWKNSSPDYFERTLTFGLGRFDEGIGFVRHFDQPGYRPIQDVLDIGTGTGGVALAFANCLRYRVSAIDIGQNRILRQVAHAAGLPVHYSLADGLRLPFLDEAFDLILLIETLEHIRRADLLGREIFRVLRPGGVCLVSTPARLRYVLGRDPHYGVRFIAGLPNGFQRFVVNTALRRRIVAPEGSSCAAYDVEHLYWYVNEIAHLFPDPKTVEPLFAQPERGGPWLSAGWWHKVFRNFLFSHVIIRKLRCET